MNNHEYYFYDINSCFIGPCPETAVVLTPGGGLQGLQAHQGLQGPLGPANTTLTLSNLNSQFMLNYNRHFIMPVVYHSETLNEYGIDIHMRSFVFKVRFSNESMYSNVMSLLGLADRLKNGM